MRVTKLKIQFVRNSGSSLMFLVCFWKRRKIKKKSTYKRHWISWRVRIVAPLPKNITQIEQNKKNIFFIFLSLMFYLSPITCHQRQQPQPQTLPLLTPPLCTVGWFTKTEPKNKTKIHNFCNLSDTLFEQKSPALSVPVDNGVDNICPHRHCNLLTELAKGQI